MLELGAHEQSIARQAMRSGRPIPDRILNAPELEEHLFLYLVAFLDLDSERTHVFSPVAIPWRSIAEYAEVYRFDEEQREDLFYFIKAMDSEHLKRLAKKAKSSNG